MILGIGIDIIEIKRIEKAIDRTANFLKGIFTENEIKYFESRNNKVETIAGYFASKEALSKALGTGVRGFSLKEIEIIKDELNKPSINISDNMKNKFNLNNANILLSISHSNDNAIAYVIIEEAINDWYSKC